mmetsp:Transcript_19423/g.62341  ORF Transcript_19423/g.62341 Transcript_19423/m.62341 type:complete len:360 (+) Transcript_19423:1090-2169(+)
MTMPTLEAYLQFPGRLRWRCLFGIIEGFPGVRNESNFLVLPISWASRMSLVLRAGLRYRQEIDDVPLGGQLISIRLTVGHGEVSLEFSESRKNTTLGPSLRLNAKFNTISKNRGKRRQKSRNRPRIFFLLRVVRQEVLHIGVDGHVVDLFRTLPHIEVLHLLHHSRLIARKDRRFGDDLELLEDDLLEDGLVEPVLLLLPGTSPKALDLGMDFPFVLLHDTTLDEGDLLLEGLSLAGLVELGSSGYPASGAVAVHLDLVREVLEFLSRTLTFVSIGKRRKVRILRCRVLLFLPVLFILRIRIGGHHIEVHGVGVVSLRPLRVGVGGVVEIRKFFLLLSLLLRLTLLPRLLLCLIRLLLL